MLLCVGGSKGKAEIQLKCIPEDRDAIEIQLIGKSSASISAPNVRHVTVVYVILYTNIVVRWVLVFNSLLITLSNLFL